MKQLEDKIKDRLEGYECSLPEGDLAEFRTLLDKSAGAGAELKAANSAWLTAAAVAAVLVLFFILRQTPGVEPIQVVDNGTAVAQTVYPLTVDENTDAVAVGSGPSVSGKVQMDCTETVKQREESPVEAATPEVKDPDSNTVYGTSKNTGGSSPFIPEYINDNKKAVSMKVGPAAACVLGGSGLIALASLNPFMLKTDASPNPPYSSLDVEYSGNVTDSGSDEKSGNNTYNSPFRAGLSLRIPFNDRWSLTSGVDYSMYSSTIGYSISGGHKQDAHYIGIPVRADFTVAGNRWFDVYVGAGASADFCVAAFDNGRKIEKDGIGFSLIGAGGVQFKITENLGVFLDPTISWNIPSGGKVLETYRTEHPLMLSASTGLRVTMPYTK